MTPTNDRRASMARTTIRVLVAAYEDGSRGRLLDALQGERCQVVQAASVSSLAGALSAASMGMLDVPDLIVARAGMLTGDVREALSALRDAGQHPMVVALVRPHEPIDSAALESAHARLLEDPFDDGDVRALVSRLVASRAPKPAPRAAMDSSV